MVGKELDAGTVDCRFPNVRKTYWRSATWNSHSAPPSPKLDPFPLERGGGGGGSAAPTDATALPYTPRSQEHNQNTRSRVSLPPLQPLSIARKNLEEWPSAGLDDTGDWTCPATPGRRRVKTGPDIKLDLASVQRTAVEPTEIQLKRDKFAHFDKQCSRVANYHIYLGSDAVARDREALRANEITHVLNCVGFVCPEYFKRELVYKTLWLQDSPCEDITSLLYDVFDYFEEVREQGGRVFVHCCQGVSRSTSLVIAYLMWRERSSFEDAFQDVKAARGVTNPNMGFACQLLQCQKRVHATPMSPTSVLRMYRLAPHSPYDPLHLVPKALNNPGAGSLDSRGAFVIHIPCAIFVWIGQDCDPKMAQAAKEAAGQVVRYERAEGPVQVLVEGHEGPEFWESLNNYSVSRGECTSAGLACLSEEHAEDFHLDSSCQAEKQRTNRDEVERVKQLGVGNRKVQSHDVDYDLYRTARLGGVIPPVPFMGVGMATIPTRIPAREDGWSVLRRKFLLGELVSAKETATPGKSNINVLSPDTSMGSSSPHYSPFSVTSTSSSAPTGSDSPFASPISVLGNLSPADTMQANTAPISLSISPSHPFISSLSIPSPMKTLSAQCANKCPAFSLAQRRGSVPPTLRLPGLEDDPPPAPRGMSRKPKLPPLVTIEKYRAEKAVKENEDTNFRFQALGEMCKGLVGVNDYMAAQLQLPLTTSSMQSSERAARDDEGQNYLQIRSTSTAGDSQCPEPRSPCKSIPEVGHAFLYLWPGLERIDMFDVDDLDTRAVFVLVEAAFHPRRNGQGIGVYVWVGRQLATNKGHQNESSRSEGEAMWLQVGKDFLDRMQLPTDVPIRVVREGQEPEEFWETFNQG